MNIPLQPRHSEHVPTHEVTPFLEKEPLRSVELLDTAESRELPHSSTLTQNELTQEVLHEQSHVPNPRLVAIESILSQGLGPYFEELLKDPTTHAHAIAFKKAGEVLGIEIDKLLNA